MNTKKLLPLYLALLTLAMITMAMLWSQSRKPEVRDYPEIKNEGILRIVTDYDSMGGNPNSDTIAGSQYELCKSIEKISGLTVEIHFVKNLKDCIEGLENNQYDAIARYIPITSDTKKQLTFTEPIRKSKQVLIQRTAEHNDSIEPLRNHLELAGKTVHVSENSPAILRIRNLAEEIGDTIYIKEEASCNSEQLIHMVAYKEIDFAVVDLDVALANKKDLPQIDCKTEISFTQFQAWAVRHTSPVLLDSLNNWLIKIK